VRRPGHLLPGVLTGRGADIILIDDPLKPEEALSDAQRKAANDWFDHTLYSRLNDKRHGAIVIIMQRLHEVVRFPAIAEVEEVHEIETIWGPRAFRRCPGEVLHGDREPVAVLDRIRRTIGEYNFAGQYQQSPAPRGGGLVKAEWFKRHNASTLPERFDRIVQSWDTANKATELSDFSVCTSTCTRSPSFPTASTMIRSIQPPSSSTGTSGRSAAKAFTSSPEYRLKRSTRLIGQSPKGRTGLPVPWSGKPNRKARSQQRCGIA
jgi:hypothetical protein